MNRRTFLERITQLFSLGWFVMLSLPVFRFLSVSSEGKSESTWHALLQADANIPQEDYVQVSLKQVQQEGWKRQIVEELLWVRKKKNGSFMVFNPHCTHLGCAFSWNAEMKQFQCPCHGGRFDADGKRIAGPPPRPLDRYETKIEDNTLKIGKLLKA
ncbi:ubiquinol-cytochrome c reductase iron-sulfur subunit [bacterium]|nr:ubiquinol-cytochrome c reductase iron-sulfur subunit [bacterium]MCI0606816.1 ubiquinol-cytochrome c reductase iron-sulfur subunit [bacterium]